MEEARIQVDIIFIIRRTLVKTSRNHRNKILMCHWKTSNEILVHSISKACLFHLVHKEDVLKVLYYTHLLEDSVNGDCVSEMSDCSSLEEGEKVAGARRNMLSIRLDRRARRLESNNRERRRMHELNAAFQVGKDTDSCTIKP